MYENIDLSGSKILIVDDTTSNIELMINILQSQNFSLMFSKTGEQALDIINRCLPDLILLDITLPDLDGYEICRNMHNSRLLAEIPVIFVTGRTDIGDLLSGFKAGGVDYICKPFFEEEILARVKIHLRTKKLLQEREKLYLDLQKQHEHTLAVVNNVSDGICTIRNTGVVESINPAGLHLFNIDKEDIVGKTIENILSSPYNEQYMKFLSGDYGIEANVIGQGPREVVGVRKDLSMFPMDFSISQLGVEANLYVGVMHDISFHKQVQNELRRVSGLDPLTNIANRRCFVNVFDLEWKNSIRENVPLTVIMMDIDFFKTYNDNHGHLRGDDCLIAVAGAISQISHRPRDIVARYGGEEFIALLPNTNESGAMKVANEMCKAVENLKINHNFSSISDYVTMSVGVTTSVPKRGGDAEEFIKKADEALYQSKNDGRNRVTFLPFG